MSWRDRATPVADEAKEGGWRSRATPVDDRVDDAGEAQPSSLPKKIGTTLKDTALGDLATAPFEGALPIGSSIPILGPLAEKAGYGLSTALETVERPLLETVFGDKKFKDLPDTYAKKFRDIPGTYAKYEAMDEGRKAKFAKEHPWANALSSLSGSAMLPVAKGAGLVDKAVNAGKWTKRAASAGDAVARVGANAALAGADASLRGQDAKTAAGVAGGISAGLEVLPPVLRGAGNFINRYMFGVKPETAAKYVARRGQINAADEHSLWNEVNDDVRSLADQVDAAKGVADDAKIDQRLASERLKEQLGGAKPPEQLSTDVLEAIKNLRSKARSGSSAALDTLGDDSHRVDDLISAIDQKLDALKVGKSPPIVGQAADDYRQLEALKTQLRVSAGQPKQLPKAAGEVFDPFTKSPKVVGNIRRVYDPFTKQTRAAASKAGSLDPATMPAADLKRYIQLLDDKSGPVFDKMRKGEHVTRGEMALIQLRREADELLKGNEAYRAAMKPVSEATGLADEAGGVFRDDKSTQLALQSLYDPVNRSRRDLLERLGKASNRDFVRDLAPYEAAQTIKGSPSLLRDAINKLPESKAASDAANSLESAQAWHEPVKGLTPEATQGLIRGVASEGRKNLAGTDKLKYLGELKGKDYLQKADDLAVKRALEQGFARGSRNVNLGAFSLGGIMGKLFKGDAAAQGVAQGVGAMLGAAADLSGPQTYKFLSDLAAAPKFQKYARMLGTALQKSPQSFAVTLSVLSKKDPAFYDYLQQRAAEAEQSLRSGESPVESLGE